MLGLTMRANLEAGDAPDQLRKRCAWHRDPCVGGDLLLRRCLLPRICTLLSFSSGQGETASAAGVRLSVGCSNGSHLLIHALDSRRALPPSMAKREG